MKLLILVSEFAPRRGGIGTYACEMARGATELGHAVTVVAPDYDGNQSALDAALPFEVIRFSGRPHSLRQLPAKIALVRALARHRPDFDIVHAADWPFYVPLALSRYRHSARTLLTFHGTEIGFMQHPKRALPLKAIGFWNGWAEYIANSRYTAASLAHAFRLPAQSIRPIGLGVGQSWLNTPLDRSTARLLHNLDESRFVIATLGRIVPRKGHLVLAEALSRLPTDIAARISWLIIGPPNDPAYTASVQSAAARLPCETRMLGALPDAEVKTLLAASDLFCLPGLVEPSGAVEGFGLVYLEAAALGLPSVATHVGGVSDAVIDGHTGLLAPPNAPAAIAAAIEKLYRDRDLLNTLGQQARAHAVSASWQSVAEATYGRPLIAAPSSSLPLYAD